MAQKSTGKKAMIKRGVLKSLGVLGIFAVGYLAWWSGAKTAGWLNEVKEPPRASENGETLQPEKLVHYEAYLKAKGPFADIINSWRSMQRKVDFLANAYRQRTELEIENANLKLQVQTAKLACRAQDALEHTQKISEKLRDEAGSASARLKNNIHFEIPKELLAPQLYTVAVTYLKAKEYGKAAVILSHLVSLEGNSTFKNPRDLLLTGMAWYHAENYRLADLYFEETLNKYGKTGDLKRLAQARLWRALAAQKQNKMTKAQFWLRELVEYHPRSREAHWVNRHTKEAKGRAHRDVASQK